MIRLNDISKTVIDEKKINMYIGRSYTSYDTDTPTFENKYEIYISNERIEIPIQYATKEARDNDIELLDKLFDTQSIEDKANAYPHEIDALKFAMSGIKEERKLVSGGEYDPVKKEEYLTWDYVKQSDKLIEAKLPNGDIKLLSYEGDDIVIEDDKYLEGRIYEEDLFNALMLKKVE